MVPPGLRDVLEASRLSLLALFRALDRLGLAQKIPQIPILQEIARKHHCSPHAAVLAWVRAKGNTVVPIPGATKPEHAVDSAKSISVKLSAKEIAAIDATEFARPRLELVSEPYAVPRAACLPVPLLPDRRHWQQAASGTQNGSETGS